MEHLTFDGLKIRQNEIHKNEMIKSSKLLKTSNKEQKKIEKLIPGYVLEIVQVVGIFN